MPMRHWICLNPSETYVAYPVEEEPEEEVIEDTLFDPEAGRASDNPFAHLQLEEAPSDEAASEPEVSEYVTGENNDD